MAEHLLVNILWLAMPLLLALPIMTSSNRELAKWTFANMWNSIRRETCGANPECAAMRGVAQLKRTWRLRALRQVALSLLFILILFSVLIIIKILREERRWMSFAQDVVCLVFCLSVIGCSLLPTRLLENRSDFILGLIMFILVVFSSPWVCAAMLPRSIHMAILIIRFVCTVLSKREAVAFVGSFFIGCSQALTLCVHAEARPKHVSVMDELIGVLVELVWLLFLGGLLRRLHDAEERLVIDVHTSVTELNANRALLDALCDAVVELNDTFKITAHVPRLADLLLHGANRMLEGRSLMDFVASNDDGQRLAQILRTPVGKGHKVVDAVHVRLCDATRAAVDVQAFHIGYLDVDDCPRHIVGIKEHSDTAESRFLPPLATSQDVEIPDRKLVTRMRGISCEVMSFCDKLSRISGLEVGASFDACLTSDCQRAFQMQYQMILHDFLASGQALQTARLGTIGLNLTPGMDAAEVAAECTVILQSEVARLQVDSSANDCDEDEPIATIELTDFRWVRSHHRRMWRRSKLAQSAGCLSGSGVELTSTTGSPSAVSSQHVDGKRAAFTRESL